LGQTRPGPSKTAKIGPKQPPGGQNHQKSSPDRLWEAKNSQNRLREAKTCQNTVKYQDFLKSAKFPIALPIIFELKTRFLSQPSQNRLWEAKNSQNRLWEAKRSQNTVKYQDFLKSAKFPIALPIIFELKTSFLTQTSQARLWEAQSSQNNLWEVKMCQKTLKYQDFLKT
jgi:hypothetical protein